MPRLPAFDAASFFAGEAPPAPELFPEASPVWEGLGRLKDFMNRRTYPTWADQLGAAPGPLSQTVVLYQPDRPDQVNDDDPARVLIIPAEECAIEYGSATKGELRVTREGELLAGASVLMAGTVLMGRRFELGRGVLVESGAFLKEPLVIQDHTEIRQGAYLRGHCLIGRRCVVGHVTEVKQTIFCDDAKAGHFAYLGDSILGPRVNLGAGTKLANLRFAAGEVQIRHPGGSVNSGLHKLGAILGADCQTGCNAVTNPGTLLAPGGIILPNTTAGSGYHPPKTMIR